MICYEMTDGGCGICLHCDRCGDCGCDCETCEDCGANGKCNCSVIPLQNQVIDTPSEDFVAIDFDIKWRSFNSFVTYIVNRACKIIITRSYNALKRVPEKTYCQNKPDYSSSDTDWIYFKFCDRQYCIRLWDIRNDGDDTRMIGHATVFDNHEA